MARSPFRSHPSAMTADQYYDAEAKKDVLNEQTDNMLAPQQPQDKQIELPKELESQIEESTRSPLTDFGTSNTFVDILDNYGMKKDVPPPLKTELNERGVPVPVESLRPKLRPKSVDPTLPYGVAPESSLRPQLRPESNEVDENSFRGAIEYIINMGYLLQDPKTGKILTGLDENNKDHQAAILGFFKQASPGFNPKKSNGTIHSWCAVFVHHVLTNLGVDTLGPDQGNYGPRRSANAYRNYGTKVDGLDNAQEGDIIVWDFEADGKNIGTHVAFYAGDRITKQDGDLVNVVGGNQGGTVSLREQERLYDKKNIVAIRRITRNDITLNLTKELAKQNPTFSQFFKGRRDPSKPPNPSLLPIQPTPITTPIGLNKGGITRSHPSAMTADEYYDAESKRLEEEDQTEESLGLSSVPFYERPLDADVTDKQVGGFGEGETPIFRTVLGNTYTVSRNPDQRTSRTKFKEDVVPAIKKFADDPRLPTKDELVSAGKAVGESVVDTVSTPKRLFTGEQSPTETQMGDAFDIAGGTALGASVMEAPKGAIRSFAGREGDPGGPTYKDRTGPYIDRQVTASFDPYSTVSKKTLGELYSNFNDVIDSDPDYPDPNATPEALKVLSDTPLRDVISIFKKIYNADGTRKLSDSEENTLVKRYLALSRQFASKYPNTINPTSGDAYKLRPNTPQFDVLKNSTELFKFYLSFMKSVRDDKEQMYFDNPFTDEGSNDPKSEIFKYDVKEVESDFPVEAKGIDVAGGLLNLPTNLQQAILGGRSLGSLGLSQNQTVKFRKPIIEVVNTIKMKPMKIQGETFDTMLGRDFLTALQKSPSIGKDSYSQILIDPDQRYTRDDLRKIVSSDEYNVNGIDFGSGYKNTQRQYLVGFAGGKEVGYFEMPILTTTPEKGRLPYSPKPTTVRMGSAHFDHEDIAHFRGSIIDPEGMLEPGDYLRYGDLDTFNYLVDGKKFLLIEEIQSDILQKGYLRDETELPKKNFKMFLQETDSQETDNPTKVRYDTAKKFGFDAEELFGKADQEGILELDPRSPIANSERRAVRDDIIEKYNKAKLAYSKSTLVPMALDQKFPTIGQLNSDYIFYEMLAKQLPEDSKRVVKPPISSSKNYKQVTDEVLKAAISKAVQSGASRIVIPSVSRFAVIRGIDKENPPKVFSSLYDKDLKKTLMELKENYPSVGINYDVVLPYRNDPDLASFDPVNDDPVDFKLGDPKGIVIDLSALMQEKELRYPRQFNKGGFMSIDDQMKEVLQ